MAVVDEQWEEVLAKDVRSGDRIRILGVRSTRVGTVVEATQTKVGLDSRPILIVVDVDGEREEITRYPGQPVSVVRA
jgi:hypothetical protein